MVLPTVICAQPRPGPALYTARAAAPLTRMLSPCYPLRNSQPHGSHCGDQYRPMSLTSIELKRFTAFSDLTLHFSPGINVLVGANGTGKTHIMKACYAACDITTKTGTTFAEKLFRVFLPSGGRIGRLVKRQVGRSKGSVSIRSGDRRLTASFSTFVRQPGSAAVSGADKWLSQNIESVYIPVKEMLSNAPGFLSLYDRRDIYFEEVYADIIKRAYLPILRGPMDQDRRRLMQRLSDAIDGRVTTRNDEFFLSNRQGNIEFTLLAEGMRKLALLWLLIQNGTLSSGSVLFWDEPETNLNPKLFRTVMDVLLEMQRSGVQIVLATHDYVILKELDLSMAKGDQVAFHSLYRDSDSGEIACRTTHDYLAIEPNAIAETFDDLYDREIERGMRERSQ